MDIVKNVEMVVVNHVNKHVKSVMKNRVLDVYFILNVVINILVVIGLIVNHVVNILVLNVINIQNVKIVWNIHAVSVSQKIIKKLTVIIALSGIVSIAMIIHLFIIHVKNVLTKLN
jgi:hypothetical protein